MLQINKKYVYVFLKIIEQHFMMKKQEICVQIEGWIQEMESYTGEKRFGRTSVAHSLLALKVKKFQFNCDFFIARTLYELLLCEILLCVNLVKNSFTFTHVLYVVLHIFSICK